MRAPILQTLGDLESSQLFPDGTDDEVLNIYLGMLQDTLEARDLDINPQDGSKLESTLEKTESHPLLSNFRSITEKAFEKGRTDSKGPLFNFGIEIEWRISLFRNGSKDVVKKFTSLPLPERCPLTIEQKDALFVSVVEAVQSRCGSSNPDWVDTFEWTTLFSYLDKDWKLCPGVNSFLEKLLARARAKKDDKGLYLIGGDNIVLAIFETLLKWERVKALEVPIIREYFDIVLRSYQAKVVVFQWLKLRERGLRGQAKRESRDQVVKELLDITPSAIYLNFVWRHLVHYNQPLLTPFLNAKDPFFGPFYVPPSERGLEKRKKEEEQPVGRAGRRGRRVPVRSAKIKKRIFSVGLENVNHRELNIKDRLKQFVKIAKSIKNDLEEVRRDDHETYFVLPACYRLHQLLPSQSEKLAVQWLNIVENTSRSIPTRTFAARRWTILPTTNYSDVVEVHERLSKAHQDSCGNPMKAVEVNIQETLLHGVILNDEPVAPLQYLVSPTFLSSNLARVTAYAINAVVKHLKSVGLTDLVALVLSGKRREGLKITAYKEMIRILASVPTSKHISMIEREWDRKELHRDVRIAIIKAGFALLHKNTEKGTRVAWKVFSQALEKQGEWKGAEEILISLLGARQEVSSYNSIFSSTSNDEALLKLFSKSIVLDYYRGMSKCLIPTTHCERFASDIVLPLAESALSDDVKMLALLLLDTYREFTDVPQRAVQLFSTFLNDEENKFFNSPKTKEQEIFDARWRQVGKSLITLTGINNSDSFDKVDQGEFLKVIEEAVKRIAAYNNAQRSKRYRALQNLEFVLNCLPRHDPDRNFPEDVEDSLYNSLSKLGNLFELYCLTRRVHRYNISDGEEKLQVLLQDLFKFGMARPMMVSKVVSLTDDLQSSMDSYNTEVWIPVVLNILKFELVPGETSTTYRSLSMRIGIQFLRRSIQGSPLVANHLPTILDFFDQVVAAGVAGHIPDLVQSAGKDLAGIVDSQTHSLESWGYRKKETFSERSKELVGHLLQRFIKGEHSSIVKDYALALLENHPLTLAYTESLVGPTLHSLMISEVPKDKLSELILKLLGSLEQKDVQNISDWGFISGRKPVNSMINVFAAFVGLRLDTLHDIGLHSSFVEEPIDLQPSTTPKSPSYVSLSLEIVMQILKWSSQLFFWAPLAFKGFVGQLVAEDLKESHHLPPRFAATAELICNAYEVKLGSLTKNVPEMEVWYEHGHGYVKELLKEAPTSSFPLFYRWIACHLTIFLGHVSCVADQKTLTNSWRPHFIHLLDTFCQDEDALIRRWSWSVDITQPVVSKDYVETIASSC
eukprot:TRINITY_DN6404_c0_g1_i5.p1 TRINITY_DN6404_c0_g1~~TRINITY_DN6404_c0_g1_i5.p1  ORF type:complete len:1309 (-),score=267.46 TRINITY_DN6404_c0_g1_i5:119-4045(-)